MVIKEFESGQNVLKSSYSGPCDKRLSSCPAFSREELAHSQAAVWGLPLCCLDAGSLANGSHVPHLQPSFCLKAIALARFQNSLSPHSFRTGVPASAGPRASASLAGTLAPTRSSVTSPCIVAHQSPHVSGRTLTD